jgi:predicted RNA methylase
MDEQLTLDGAPDLVVALAQYDTPDPLAMVQARLAAHALPWSAGWGRATRILEPSAGKGALVRALRAELPNARIDAVELDPARAALLRELAADASIANGDRLAPAWFDVWEGDYLSRPAPSRRYDLGVSNPPFSKGAETPHLAKMMDECQQLVWQLPIRSLHGQARTEAVWSRFISGEWHVRAEVRVCERVYPNASDDIIVQHVSRERGPCSVAWWRP